MHYVEAKAWVGMRDWVKVNNLGNRLRYFYDIALVGWHYWYLVCVPKKHD